jgi:hypothetical protein
MILGFTGTRKGLTDVQTRWLWELFERLQVDEAHHGACVGADLEFHKVALHHGVPIVVHPPVKTEFLAVECIQRGVPRVKIKSAKPYLHRDRDIAGACDGLVATPWQDAEPPLMDGSGTFYTVRYAQRLNKPVMICFANGRVEKREIATQAQGPEYE